MINGCLIRQWVCNSRKIIEWKVQTICTRWMIRHTGKVEPILATNVESIMVGFIQWPLILHISLGALHGVDVIATRGKLDAKNWPRTRWGRSKLRKGMTIDHSVKKVVGVGCPPWRRVVVELVEEVTSHSVCLWVVEKLVFDEYFVQNADHGSRCHRCRRWRGRRRGRRGKLVKRCET